VTATTTRTSPNGRTRARPAPNEWRPSAGSARRRQVPWIVLGVFLVVGFALMFAVVSLRANATTRVLALTRSVAAGHVLRSSDLREVGVSAGPGLSSVPATSEASVVGRPVAVPLAAGALLTPNALGTPRSLNPGEAVVGLALKPGQFPPGLSAGDHVRVVDTSAAAPSSSSASVRGATAPAVGVVLSVVAASSSDGSAVVSLRVADGDANAVALLASAGHASVVLLPPTES
jgi:hypothetical protein